MNKLRLSLPPSMRLATLTAYTGAQAIALVEQPLPQPGPGEVLVKVVAAPINPSDQMFLLGSYGSRRPLPTGLGFEGSGVVVAAGAGVQARALLGRRVAFAANERGGTWADYSLAYASMCVPLLPGVSTVRGSMLLVNPLTAWALVDIARKQSPAIVQTAAAGTLGHMVQRLAKRYSIPVINIVRRPEQRDLLHKQGATYVLDSSAADFDKQLHDLSRQLKARVVFEAVAGATTGRILAGMPGGSQAIVYGALSLERLNIEPGEFVFRDQRVSGFWLSSWLGQVSPVTLLRAGILAQRLLNSDLASSVRACLPLEQIHKALALYAGDMTGGKVLLMPAFK